ncbi:hypothetical protein MBAV_006231 [Candidatus Magnetobacterium bavaricum]|uniref:Uncharacterized protein n=1 Tax=Candidatus Magnetobacterium bavaricum TaxID=29290 RepID=A0A0F3GIC3_9BACT|nr:hypothetical protein MBAV_006231 [Candidatus Magnetobacterium bavaricum]
MSIYYYNIFLLVNSRAIGVHTRRICSVWRLRLYATFQNVPLLRPPTQGGASCIVAAGGWQGVSAPRLSPPWLKVAPAPGTKKPLNPILRRREPNSPSFFSHANQSVSNL